MSNSHVDEMRQLEAGINSGYVFGLLSGTSGVAADLLPLAVGCLHCTVLQVTADPVCTYGKLKVGQCVCRGDLIALKFSMLLS